MCKASDIYKEYKHRLNSDVKETDVYVALNKKYHKYYNLLNKWGISDIDKFIVEITMVDCFDLQYNIFILINIKILFIHIVLL